MNKNTGMKPHRDRLLKLARAYVSARSSYDLSPKQIIMARRMANDDAELGEIMAALDWQCPRSYASERLLKKYRIRARTKRGHPHRGDPPYLNYSVGERSLSKEFKPREFSA